MIRIIITLGVVITGSIIVLYYATGGWRNKDE